VNLDSGSVKAHYRTLSFTFSLNFKNCYFILIKTFPPMRFFIFILSFFIFNPCIYAQKLFSENTIIKENNHCNFIAEKIQILIQGKKITFIKSKKYKKVIQLTKLYKKENKGKPKGNPVVEFYHTTDKYTDINFIKINGKIIAVSVNNLYDFTCLTYQTF
jgi:hypothetical protein